jgi:hypothetical protein
MRRLDEHGDEYKIITPLQSVWVLRHFEIGDEKLLCSGLVKLNLTEFPRNKPLAFDIEDRTICTILE